MRSVEHVVIYLRDYRRLSEIEAVIELEKELQEAGKQKFTIAAKNESTGLLILSSTLDAVVEYRVIGCSTLYREKIKNAVNVLGKQGWKVKEIMNVKNNLDSHYTLIILNRVKEDE